MADEKITIPKYFQGKNIFITGGTGFMGKVLIEKLLRSCPEVSKIYILIRHKKGKSPQERVNQILKTPLFDVLKKEHPENVKKIVPVLGDVTELGLGLSPEDRQKLLDEVNVVYHGAASVRFDDFLKTALIMNTRGTREVVYLAKEMKHLEVFVHLSTAYCHADKQVVEERMYPPYADWSEAIEVAEKADPHTLNILTSHYTNPMPNTYCFSKRLSEHVVNDLCEGHIPTVLFRPSIVISTIKEPVPGWIDNFNGPVGILVASGKGILRSVYSQPDLTADYVPVDIVIKGLIMATWKKALEKDEKEKLKLEVYNACNNDVKNVTLRELVAMGMQLCWENPLNNVLWYPCGYVTSCYPNHFFRVIFFHILPALIVDGLLKITGNKPMLLKIQRKIYIANMALQYFITHQWKFINDKVVNLEDSLVPSDQKAFSFERHDAEPFDYFRKAMFGARQYLLNEDISTLGNAKKHSRRMYVLYVIFNTLWYLGILYIVVFKIDIIRIIGDLVDKIYLYFNAL